MNAFPCRWTEILDIEGCPLITTRGLEAVVIYLRDLRHLSVSNCSMVRDEEISERLADVVFSLKELKWQPSAGKISSGGLMKAGQWLLV